MSCTTGKIPYATRAEAAKALAAFRQRKHLGDKADVFKCNHCGEFHWGRDRRASPEARRNRDERKRQWLA